MKRSRILRLGAAISLFQRLADKFAEDRVTVYAAEASFFVMISAVPFLSLLFAVIGLFMSADLTTLLRSLTGLVPTVLLNIFAELITELRDIPTLSLLSVSALTTLWSASRGIASIRNGIRTVYGIPRQRGFLRSRFTSLIYTVCFMFIILAAVIILLFGDFLYEAVRKAFLPSHAAELIFRFRGLIFTVLVSFVFTVMYTVIAGKSRIIESKLRFHLPGAVLAAVGWGVFSGLYALYISRFSQAHSLYGGLTAVCLIMLWLYFCMIILLGGAEVNKALRLRKRQQDIV